MKNKKVLPVARLNVQPKARAEGSPKSVRQGFTLIELLVVIAIIGLLSTLAVVALNNARSKARDARRTSDLRAVRSALELYRGDTDDAVPASASMANWAALGTALTSYLPAGAPTDPSTGRTYVYCSERVGTVWNYVLSATLENSSANSGGLTGATNYGTDNCVNQTDGLQDDVTCNAAGTVFCLGSRST